MKKTDKLIAEIMKTLKERGRFENVAQIEEFFENSLNEVKEMSFTDIRDSISKYDS